MNTTTPIYARLPLVRAWGLIVIFVALLSPSLRAQQETLRLFWSTAGLVNPANNNGFTDFPAIGADPALPTALVPTRLYLWARFEGGGEQSWNVITFNVDFTGDPNAQIVARDFWSLTTSVAPRWAIHDDGVLSGNSLTGVTLVALPPFSYGATNNATIMVHDPHWSADTQVLLLGWVDLLGSGAVHLSVGAGAIQQLDAESDSVQFGWGDAAISGSNVGAASALPDATFIGCEVDTDGDGAADCIDECDNDPAKVAPGLCGCGVSDDDTDGDGVADCSDSCPLDVNKVTPGVCGCGQSELDSDSDGLPDCVDACPTDPQKTEPGVCGCGVSEEDSDGDGTLDCEDECPFDPQFTQPGVCGCGVLELDSDEDGVPDCVDGCPLDPAKSDPGFCGCGEADLDSDGDGVFDCVDACPLDPVKSAPGVCGCGVDELFVDSDNDGVIDCFDGCPLDPAKDEPGWCGCGVVEDPQDFDGDGVPDCGDECPRDPLKSIAGDCGCYQSDLDTDGDGLADCVDRCPLDPNKFVPGKCGCGVPDVDSDGDGILDCKDECPLDPSKFEVGLCGCGIPDSVHDTDGDGVADCLDGCPLDPSKKIPGLCGCGVPDSDLDLNGIADCVDAGFDPVCGDLNWYGSVTTNSSGNAGLLTTSGSFQVAREDLLVGAVGLPADVVCILYSGTRQTQTPFESGTLLVNPPAQNGFAKLASSLGTVEFQVDYTSGQLVPGVVRTFQIVYLDSGGANTTNALNATFCP